MPSFLRKHLRVTDGPREEDRIKVHVDQVVEILEVLARHRVTRTVRVRERIQEGVQRGLHQLRERLLHLIFSASAKYRVFKDVRNASAVRGGCSEHDPENFIFIVLLDAQNLCSGLLVLEEGCACPVLTEFVHFDDVVSFVRDHRGRYTFAGNRRTPDIAGAHALRGRHARASPAHPPGESRAAAGEVGGARSRPVGRAHGEAADHHRAADAGRGAGEVHAYQREREGQAPDGGKGGGMAAVARLAKHEVRKEERTSSAAGWGAAGGEGGARGSAAGG
mmetsp:Transcript_13217/g.25071  ORF Transcript_13217/g.25071 Transcript_13217/m.25071 type:complete len:278 (-) Transcript_13217:23-856(-)